MKSVLRILLFLVVSIAVVISIGACIISIRGIPKYTPKKLTLQIEPTQERVDKGLKLASMLCHNCHYNAETNKLTGRHMSELGNDFGNINSLNITKDPNKGIGNWTDGELIYFLRTGVKPDGQYVPPYMVKLPHISDEDMASVIAYLRSDHPYVQANTVELPPSKPSFLVKFLTQFAFVPFEYPTKPIPSPDTTNIIEWGKYLALYQLECYSCHSSDFKTNNYLEPEKSEGFFGGGNVLLDLDGHKIASRNISPDKENGIGNWTEDQFVRALKFGLRDNKPALRNPMMPYSQLSDNEAKAIFAYLKTVPVSTNKVADL